VVEHGVRHRACLSSLKEILVSHDVVHAYHLNDLPILRA